MICLECVNGLTRKFPGERQETICCMDSRIMMAVVSCDMFIKKVPEEIVVEKHEVVDLGYGAVPEEVYGRSVVEDANEYMEKEQKEVKRGRGRPRKT
jgi:hypothetical protein